MFITRTEENYGVRSTCNYADCTMQLIRLALSGLLYNIIIYISLQLTRRPASDQQSHGTQRRHPTPHPAGGKHQQWSVSALGVSYAMCCVSYAMCCVSYAMCCVSYAMCCVSGLCCND